jgi:hypothetical protein
MQMLENVSQNDTMDTLSDLHSQIKLEIQPLTGNLEFFKNSLLMYYD